MFMLSLLIFRPLCKYLRTLPEHIDQVSQIYFKSKETEFKGMNFNTMYIHFLNFKAVGKQIFMVYIVSYFYILFCKLFLM